MQKPLQTSRIVATVSGKIKAQIIRSCIRMGDLATEAGVHPATLSLHLHGRRRSYKTQIRIYDAFCRLTDKKPTHLGAGRFWGDLLGRKMQ